MRKALLSDWERKTLEQKQIDRRLKFKIQQRLGTALDALNRDIETIAHSKHLFNFNVRNLSKWSRLSVISDTGYRYLFQKVGRTEIRIETVDSVRRGDRDHYYIGSRERIRYDRKSRVMVLGHFQRNEDDRRLFDTVYRFLHNSKELKIRLSLRRIRQPYPKRILRKALKYGYKFPNTPQDARPLFMIREWVESKEL